MTLKAREVVFKLKDANLNPELMKVLTQLAEEHAQFDKAISEQGAVLVQLVDLVSKFDRVALGMKQKIEEIEKKRIDPNQDLGGSTDGLN